MKKVTRFNSFRHAAFIGLSMVVSASAWICVKAEAAETARACEVSWAVLGTEVLPTDSLVAQEFAESLKARPGLTVREVKAGSGVWGAGGQGKTAGVTPVSLVNVAVGKHRDLLLFVVDEKGTTVLAALRRECQVARKSRRDWSGPGPFQIPENAARELAQDYGHLKTDGLKAEPGKRVSVSVMPWKNVAAELAGGFSDAPDAGSKAAQAAPMEPSGADGVQAVNTLAFAALAQAGAQPTTEAAAATLTIEVARNVDHYALRYTMKSEGKSREYAQRFISQNELYDHMEVAGKLLWAWGDDVRSAAKLGDGAVEPLAAGKGVAAVGVGGVIRGFEPVSGRDSWPGVIAKRAVFPYGVLMQGNESQVVRMGKPSELVDIQTGKWVSVAGDAPVLPWGMELGAGGRAAVVNDAKVTFNNGAKELWKTSLADPISAGPAVNERAVFVANESGDVVALGAADGSEIWRKPTGLRLCGAMTVMGESLIATSFDGTVVALGTGDGKELWRHAARDVLLARPCLVDGFLLLADKGSVVWLLDPKTGEAKASFATPTWLVNAVMVEEGGKKWVVCSDLGGTVRFLSLPGLKVVREVGLGTRLSKPIVLAGGMPSAWGSGNEIDQKTSAVLVGDQKGWIYLIDLPR